MDEHSPLSLVDACLACVCQSLDTLCSVCDDGSLRLHSCPVFPPELSDLLLSTLSDEGLLNDRTLGIYRSVECLRLKRACVRASRLTAASFRRSLCSHRLQELDASHILGDITVSDILQGLSANQACCQSLQRLSVSGLGRLWDLPVSFRSLQGLRSLSVAWTPLDDSTLEDVCSLPLLESLDISGTNVTDLTPLLRLRSRLHSLTLHALHHLKMTVDDFISLLSELEFLTQLDVSNDQMQMRGEMIRKLLENMQILPALMALDVSGWKGISDEDLKAFLEARTGMRFIGLLATGAGRSDFLSGEGNLKVAGEWNLTQLCEALMRYRERESFLQEALICLYKHINDTDIKSPGHLLRMVQQKASMGVWDYTLKSTLTALWGLTDNTHSACTHFLQYEGLELYKELLETYYFNPMVLKQILGLLNNVSELEDLRAQLMDEDLVQLVLNLLELKEVEVSYFAGGFLANITSSNTWSLDTELRHEILTKLHSAVMSWTPPDNSMVSYRSLCPFYPLLSVSQPTAIQLWALWGIKHICTHKVSHYRRMLEDEGGMDILHTLTSDPNTHSDVQTLAIQTLHLMEG